MNLSGNRQNKLWTNIKVITKFPDILQLYISFEKDDLCVPPLPIYI